MHIEQWANYFVATAGGAAALAGLIFVSVSLNLKKILSLKQLPGRALESLLLLINILITGSFCLVPGSTPLWLGVAVEACSSFVWILNTRMDIMMLLGVGKDHRHHYLQNLVFTQAATLPFLTGGIFLINGTFSGLYWLVAGITLSFIKALLDAWVLLVEINR
jgi:hypothetical protein